MRLLRSILIAGALAGLLAGSSALAQSNYWIGTTGGDYTNTANWYNNQVPGTLDRAFFTNATSQTITFSTSVTNKPVQIFDTPVSFDLNGYIWVNGEATSPLFDLPGNNLTSAAPVTVHFSSGTNALVNDGNYVKLGPVSGYQNSNIRGPVTLQVDDELGYPVKLLFAVAQGGFDASSKVIVEGPGSEFEVYNGGSSCQLRGPILVTNGATFRWDYDVRLGNQAMNQTTTVVNAHMRTGGGRVGGRAGLNPPGWATVDLSNGSDWYDSGNLDVGAWQGAQGFIILSNSAFVGQSMVLGQSQYSRGDLQILDSTATFSNRLVLTPNFYSQYASFTTTGAQSRLVLKNGTINLGGGGTAGALTNFGVMRAAGTIKGLDSSQPAMVYAGAGSSNWIGSSIGSLTLNNANLELAAGSVTLWEFSDTGLDQINVVDGWASLDGTNLFSLAAGSAAPTPGVKWGLGVYDFVLGTGVTVGANFYANMTNLLSSAPYSLVYGTDYRFGLVDTGSYEALRLEFVPEPSTVLLLVGGGLLLYRVRRKK